MGFVKFLQQKMLKYMREWPVPTIVQEGGYAAHVHFVAAYDRRYFWVNKNLPREVHDAKAMLKACVVGAGVNVF
jgi:hypothetical protein